MFIPQILFMVLEMLRQCRQTHILWHQQIQMLSIQKEPGRNLSHKQHSYYVDNSAKTW